MGEQEVPASAARLDPHQMALVLRQQALELVEQLLGNHRRAPKLAKVRNDSPLRFNVTLALRDMTLRHFQGGLMVHFWPCIPIAGWARLLFGRRPVAPFPAASWRAQASP